MWFELGMGLDPTIATSDDLTHNLPTNQNSLTPLEPNFLSNGSTYSLTPSPFVDNLSIGRSTTSSTTSTVPGPGALSGKAILALGKATLRGAEKLIIWKRVQVINTRFPHNNGDEFPGAEKMYEDILELARRDMYAKGLRSHMLKIILVQIANCQTDLLIKTLTAWAPVEVGIFLTDLTEILNPLRLSTANKDGELSREARAYRDTLNGRGTHSLEPLILFFQQLGQYSLLHNGPRISRIIMESSVMDFLVLLYHSNFADPFHDYNAITYDEKQAFHRLCESLFFVCLRAYEGQYKPKPHQIPFNKLWPKAQQQHNLLARLKNHLGNDIEMPVHVKPYYIISFIRLILHAMDDHSSSESIENSSIHDQVSFNLTELSRFSSFESEIGFLALTTLYKLTSFQGSGAKNALLQYLASRQAKDLFGLMLYIYEWISEMISMDVTKWGTFISQWYWKPYPGPFSRRHGTLEIIDYFVKATENNSTPLKYGFKANIVSLLRPFLEVELQAGPPSQHEQYKYKTFNGTDLAILNLIYDLGCAGFFTTSGPYPRTRTILAHAGLVRGALLRGDQDYAVNRPRG